MVLFVNVYFIIIVLRGLLMVQGILFSGFRMDSSLFLGIIILIKRTVTYLALRTSMDGRIIVGLMGVILRILYGSLVDG